MIIVTPHRNLLGALLNGEYTRHADELIIGSHDAISKNWTMTQIDHDSHMKGNKKHAIDGISKQLKLHSSKTLLLVVRRSVQGQDIMQWSTTNEFIHENKQRVPQGPKPTHILIIPRPLSGPCSSLLGNQRA